MPKKCSSMERPGPREKYVAQDRHGTINAKRHIPRIFMILSKTPLGAELSGIPELFTALFYNHNEIKGTPKT
jgi:hypothetical protein